MQAQPTGKGTVRVSGVLDGSPAQAAGVREGDTVVRIAGEEVTEASYFKLKDRLKKDGETVTIELRRGDKPVVATVKLRRLV
jgi:S1-C subfamily serine protease